ncbi:cytochrome b/b6 domain-containing protein [Niveispirillum sp.]|uniref:cytochrome b/b6 domain-containing protein n=1 Tax=Niveispirillum sp. TaxID=1917217 RepID=UPI001B4E66A8|nr:cytochrome b/b6 domain-containing protein [Niveispirillum sp.]MBP7337771.1 cytochrome b/b6 domain-containing protein [Niveispirillum sp.]
MRKILVWDLPTRLFHWLLVLCIAGAWITGENEAYDWHMRFGYAILGLVLFRILWGLVGSDTARFAQFVRGPAAIRQHIAELRQPGRMHPHMGHNALGALAVLGLLLVVAVQAGSGLFTSDGVLTDGPLVERVSGSTASLMRSIHLNNFNILLAMAGLHVVAILAYALFKRLDLVRPMVTGRAAVPGNMPGPRIVSLVRALVVAALSATTIWALVSYA